ncbi:nucleotidyltransferase family protein [Neorhizobium sp. JUb45]|uniref:nucleotidyltransferase family protein n=1 Tax=unclassified Neorhizobium TaxID=2629175 RepID=UPI0010492049|nr:nucleotidyltransferase family protein [Neorhizobium sp. JUb45]TCR06690.1 hypothetical protein EDF70_101651 [Neorhizobium sp. JUb45]
MRPSEVLNKNRQAIREATKRFNAANPRVFGSVARGEDGVSSDIDILVDTLPDTTLLDLGGLQDALETLLEAKVDLVTSKGIRSAMRERILAEAMPI